MDNKHKELDFQLIVDASPVALILVDDSGKIIMINKQTEKLFDYTRNELTGKNVEILVPGRFREKHPELRRSFNANPQSQPMGAGRDLFAVNKDGTEFPVEIGLNPIEKNGAKLVLTSIIDITSSNNVDEEQTALKEYHLLDYLYKPLTVEKLEEVVYKYFPKEM